MNVQNNVTKLDTNIPPAILENVYNTQGDNCKWARLVLTWNEPIMDKYEKLTGETREHRYAALINRETGGFYLDCRPQKIFWKFLLTTPGHILSGFVKWATFAKKIIADANALCNPKGKDAKRPSLKDRTIIGLKCLKDLGFESLRTAFYSIALAVISAVGVVFAFMAVITTSRWLESRVYDIREFSGKTEAKFTRGEWGITLAACFQEQDDPVKKYAEGRKAYLMTRESVHPGVTAWEEPYFIKQFGQEELMRGMNMFARANIRERRKGCIGLFNDTCSYESGKVVVCKLDERIIYHSKSYDRMTDAVYQRNVKPLLADPAEQQAFSQKARAWSTV